MNLKRIVLQLAWIVPVLVLGTYVFNPLGIPTWDPRGRLLGGIPYRLPSESMSPTYNPGDYVVACTAAYFNSVPAAGEVIVFVPPPPEQGPYIKRVVGIAGDTLRFDGAEFFRNGKRQDERYVASGDELTDIGQFGVPAGTVFVAGDNRAHSVDSRHFGPVPTGSIIGRVCAKI